MTEQVEEVTDLGAMLRTEFKPMSWHGVPEHMHGTIERYVIYGIPGGSFFQAVVENNLMRALQCADQTNQMQIYCYLEFAVAELPHTCWGSPERVADWMAQRQTEDNLRRAVRDAG